MAQLNNNNKKKNNLNLIYINSVQIYRSNKTTRELFLQEDNWVPLKSSCGSREFTNKIIK